MPSDMPTATGDLQRRWLQLCGLDTPDAPADRVEAALLDLRNSYHLAYMLKRGPDAFRQWWRTEDHTRYHLTTATGGTDWAWLALARASHAVSQFGDLH